MVLHSHTFIECLLHTTPCARQQRHHGEQDKAPALLELTFYWEDSTSTSNHIIHLCYEENSFSFFSFFKEDHVGLPENEQFEPSSNNEKEPTTCGQVGMSIEGRACAKALG